MENKYTTGVCFVFNQNGHVNQLDYNKLADFVEGEKNVSQVWEIPDVLKLGAARIQSGIRVGKINRIVIAGENPGFIKPLFSKAMANSGQKPDNVVVVNFNEYGIHSNESAELAKILLMCAINNIPVDSLLKSGQIDVNPNTLVIGGGIAGIQASLEIANANNKVYLVEKTGTIGGHMAMFDKTFPTLDCAACILTPKMVEVGQHKNIELMTYCEVQEVTGRPGNFKAKILKKARRVDLATCIGCGTCAEKCPAKASSEFDEGAQPPAKQEEEAIYF